MADALISPAVGGTMWATSAGLVAWCARKVRKTLDDRMIPMMGVLGAFIFAAQMINFAIPVTGSSGHLGGGLILTILLGPEAAFIVITSVLTVQALFFADGGLLALGCNIFNMGFFPAFVAYPLIYKTIAGDAQSGRRLWVGAMMAGLVSLQLGALSVVLETTLSGISALPFQKFVLVMLPIHLAIGVVEGVITAAVISFVCRAQLTTTKTVIVGSRRVAFGILIAAVLVGGGLSWFASKHPDGLEWATGKVSGQTKLENHNGIREAMAQTQAKTALFPHYDFKGSVPTEPQWPAVRAGTSVSGLVGGLLTLTLAGLIGYGLKWRAAG